MARSASRRALRTSAALVIALMASAAVQAEPYLAVMKGVQCSTCHTNPAGGGKRNTYGNVYSQTELPTRRISDPGTTWTA